MKAMFLALMCATFLFSSNVMASPQAEEGQSQQQQQCTPAAEPEQSKQQSFEAIINGDEASAEARPNAGYWHCTAYAPGSGHHDGHDYRDVHYNHAYWGARRACEYYHGYCSDVHCHYDHH